MVVIQLQFVKVLTDRLVKQVMKPTAELLLSFDAQLFAIFLKYLQKQVWGFMGTASESSPLAQISWGRRSFSRGRGVVGTGRGLSWSMEQDLLSLKVTPDVQEWTLSIARGRQ